MNVAGINNNNYKNNSTQTFGMAYRINKAGFNSAEKKMVDAIVPELNSATEGVFAEIKKVVHFKNDTGMEFLFTPSKFTKFLAKVFYKNKPDDVTMKYIVVPSKLNKSPLEKVIHFLADLPGAMTHDVTKMDTFEQATELINVASEAKNDFLKHGYN